MKEKHNLNVIYKMYKEGLISVNELRAIIGLPAIREAHQFADAYPRTPEGCSYFPLPDGCEMLNELSKGCEALSELSKSRKPKKETDS